MSKAIYTHQNRIIVSHAKNLLEQAGIAVKINNEFAGGAAGDLAAIDTWMEIHLIDEADRDPAMQILATLAESENSPEWLCPQCKESNPGNFETCWQCGAIKSN